MLKIQVVGPGCKNCEKLYGLCQEVIAENHLDAEIEKITDRNRFVELGIFLTPALIVNGNILSSGKIPTKHTLAHWLNDAVNA
jgi:small redox-active disulfide protein 2